jgi:hypothetical protein
MAKFCVHCGNGPFDPKIFDQHYRRYHGNIILSKQKYCVSIDPSFNELELYESFIKSIHVYRCKINDCNILVEMFNKDKHDKFAHTSQSLKLSSTFCQSVDAQYSQTINTPESSLKNLSFEFCDSTDDGNYVTDSITGENDSSSQQETHQNNDTVSTDNGTILLDFDSDKTVEINVDSFIGKSFESSPFTMKLNNSLDFYDIPTTQLNPPDETKLHNKSTINIILHKLFDLMNELDIHSTTKSNVLLKTINELVSLSSSFKFTTDRDFAFPLILSTLHKRLNIINVSQNSGVSSSCMQNFVVSGGVRSPQPLQTFPFCIFDIMPNLLKQIEFNWNVLNK